MEFLDFVCAWYTQYRYTITARRLRQSVITCHTSSHTPHPPTHTICMIRELTSSAPQIKIPNFGAVM